MESIGTEFLRNAATTQKSAIRGLAYEKTIAAQRHNEEWENLGSSRSSLVTGPTALGRHLLVRERRDLGALARMFNRDRANVAVTIQVHDRVLVQVFGFEDRCLAEFDIEGVGICKIFDFHGTNDRSKNAL